VIAGPQPTVGPVLGGNRPLAASIIKLNTERGRYIKKESLGGVSPESGHFSGSVNPRMRCSSRLCGL
jgi:hypothetical protein